MLLGILAATPSAASATPRPTPSPSPLRPSDLWSWIEDTPGAILDRVNVAGTEAALQPAVVWRGDPATGTTWTLDGIDVSDPASPGSLAMYLHPALVGHTVASPGSVFVRTGGLPIELRSRGDRRAAVFARLAPGSLSSDNVSADLRESALQINESRHLAELGASAGTRLRSGVEIGGGATWMRHRQQAFTEHGETHRLTSILARLSAPLDGADRTRVTVSMARAEKVHDDRDTTLSALPEARWRQSGPVYFLAAHGRRVLSATATVSLKAGYLDSTFRLDPAGGTSADPFEDFRGVFRGSYLSLHSKRRRLHVGADVSERRGPLTLTAGLSYRRAPVSTQSGWPGDKVQAFEREQVFFRTFRLTGFAIPTRDQDVRSVQSHWEAHTVAVFTRESFEASVGLRVDRLSGRNEAVAIPANPLVPELLPAMTFAGAPARFRWLDVLPRVALGWRPRKHEPWRLDLRYHAYAGPLGSGDVTFDHPGRDVASMSYYWRDRNEDRVVQADEIEVARGRLGSSGLDPDRPGAPVSLHQIDPDLRAPRTHEWSLSAETRSGTTTAGVTTYYRRNSLPLWRPVRGLRRADYAIRGAVRGTLFEDAYSVGYYAPASASRIPPGNGRILTNREGYHQDVAGVELAFEGRLRRLRWRAWASASDWRERFDDEEVAVIDPTSTDGEPNRNAGAAAVRTGGFGRDLFVNARWSGGLDAHVPLPAGFAADAFLHARQGFPIPYVHVANAGDPTAGAKSVLVSPSLDAYRLPAVVELDLRLERAWTVRGGRLVAGADVFNSLNSAPALQVNRDVESPSFSAPREVLRPRIVRLGLTFEF